VLLHCRVPTLPGKSWISFCKISKPWKVLENGFGPGNFIGYDVEGGQNDAGLQV